MGVLIVVYFSDYNSSVGISEEWMHGFPGMQTELPPQILHEWGVQTIELSRIEFNKTETPSKFHFLITNVAI